jgi:hypothetical protein
MHPGAATVLTTSACPLRAQLDAVDAAGPALLERVPRTSDFLPWHAAYAELHFTPNTGPTSTGVIPAGHHRIRPTPTPLRGRPARLAPVLLCTNLTRDVVVAAVRQRVRERGASRRIWRASARTPFTMTAGRPSDRPAALTRGGPQA